MKEIHKNKIFNWAHSMSVVPEVFEYQREKRIFGLKSYKWQLT
jgi:hypothetical protein